MVIPDAIPQVMIHSCNKRLDYVNDHLIPSLCKHGINRIVVNNDHHNEGCLASFVKSCDYIKKVVGPKGGMWHLQDDVILSKHFGEYVKEMDHNFGIVKNGFVHKGFNPKEYMLTGTQPVKNYWMSFPCIYIPNFLAIDFYEWFNVEVITKGKYKRYLDENKYDDFFFWTFMKARHGDEFIFNVAPNMVNHIDYLLGGSQVNPHHAKRTLAYYWDEEIPEKI